MRKKILVGLLISVVIVTTIGSSTGVAEPGDGVFDHLRVLAEDAQNTILGGEHISLKIDNSDRYPTLWPSCDTTEHCPVLRIKFPDPTQQYPYRHVDFDSSGGVCADGGFQANTGQSNNPSIMEAFKTSNPTQRTLVLWLQDDTLLLGDEGADSGIPLRIRSTSTQFVNVVKLGNDPNFYIYTAPWNLNEKIINFAPGEYIHYFTDAHRWEFIVDGTVCGYIDVNGFHNGAP